MSTFLSHQLLFRNALLTSTWTFQIFPTPRWQSTLLRSTNQIRPLNGIRTLNDVVTQTTSFRTSLGSAQVKKIDMTEKVEPVAQADVTQPQTTEEDPPVADEQEQEKKEVEEVKEKKPRTPRARKPRQPKVEAHPPYFQMIEEAILALKEKSGSSPYAIAKFMEENHKSVLPANFRKILALQIKNSVSRGKLTKIRASYKLPEAGNQETINGGRARPAKTRSTSKAEAEKKPKDARPNPKTVATKKKVPGVKKAGKSGSAAVAKPKQPRSIKSAGARRMKVVSAV